MRERKDMETLYRGKQVDCRWREKRKSFLYSTGTIYIRVHTRGHVLRSRAWISKCS